MTKCDSKIRTIENGPVQECPKRAIHFHRVQVHSPGAHHEHHDQELYPNGPLETYLVIARCEEHIYGMKSGVISEEEYIMSGIIES